MSPSLRQVIERSVVAILLVAIGVFFGRYIIPASDGQNQPFSIIALGERRNLVFPTFWEAWDVLHERYLDAIDDKNLLYGAVAGMVRAAGDPYTVFSDPDDAKQFEETLSGQFSGVGIEIGLKKGLVMVIAPLEGSPAKQAGIREGDIVVGVDDVLITQDMTLDEIVRKIRGPRGSTVILKVFRAGDESTRDVSIVRDTIVVESVRFEMHDSVTRISITSFNGDTKEQFTSAARELRKIDPAGIVIDVRNNPGGYLQSAVDIASFFLDPGTLVVEERGKSSKEYRTRGNGVFRDIPLVVLINGGSASASEILAGALQDQRTVPIVGTKSFGKGSVQELVTLSDRSSMRVTVAKWFTPHGRSITDQGIEPTEVIEDDDNTEDDEQLQRALEIIAK